MHIYIIMWGLGIPIILYYIITSISVALNVHTSYEGYFNMNNRLKIVLFIIIYVESDCFLMYVVDNILRVLLLFFFWYSYTWLIFV